MKNSRLSSKQRGQRARIMSLTSDCLLSTNFRTRKWSGQFLHVSVMSQRLTLLARMCMKKSSESTGS
jgi:hypothetical protein